MTEQTQPTDALAKLRHLYANMLNGGVRDTASAKRIAEVLLSPAIEALEKWGTPAGAGEVVAYLDIGTGYLDLGTALSDDELLRLPKGRHALVIVGTYGVDGYTTPQPTQAQAGAVPAEFLRSVIALCTQRGYSPENIEAWSKDDKWVADLWRQADEMLTIKGADHG